MNYYEHHIGDFAEATAHLAFVEDAAYSRMIRKYYAQEKPLPPDIKAVQRLVGARTKDERQAVVTVLEEFFALRDDGYHNARCDEEIARYQDKQRKAKASADARWNKVKPASDGNADDMRPHDESDANASPENDVIAETNEKNNSHQGLVGEKIISGAAQNEIGDSNTKQKLSADSTMRSHSEGNAHQTPDTRHQSPDLKTNTNTASETLKVGDTNSDSSAVSAAGKISIALRANGVMSNPADPRVLELVAQGVSPQTVAAACQDAKAAKPNERIGIGYVFAILKRWSIEAKAMQVKGAQPPSATKQDGRAAAAASIGLGARSHVERDITPD